MIGPLRLRSDNFTPPTRTPWGGTKIPTRYKAGVLTGPASGVVGESWEISVEPSFPSRVHGTDRLLADHIAQDPTAWLGPEVCAAYGGQTPLLVKLLDTSDNLSVQVHPAMDDPALGPDESGKPESWIVLEADPGAGIYLGLRDGVDRATVQDCLTARGRLDELLNFVPCSPGDCFVIDAGTVHAIGAGMTLLEPQHVAPGKRGLTYRYWDWNRLYDEHGKRSPNGSPRELHVERSLAVTRYDATGPAFVERCRSRPKPLSPSPVEHVLLLRSAYFEAESLRGAGAATLQVPSMTGVTVLTGQIEVAGVAASAGQSLVVPACMGRVTLTLQPDTYLIATRSRA